MGSDLLLVASLLVLAKADSRHRLFEPPPRLDELDRRNGLKGLDQRVSPRNDRALNPPAEGGDSVSC